MGATYHVICRGNNRAAVFHAPEDYAAYLDIVHACQIEIPFAIHHYCLLTNHVHLCIQPDDDMQLPGIMQRINQRYSLYHKERYGFVGHLWQCRYRRFLAADDAYLLTCGIYIELNPVRAGIVEDPTAYRWSSARYYLAGEYDRLITPSPAFLALGNSAEERIIAYRALTDMWIRRPVDKKAAKKFFKNGAPGHHPLLAA